MCRRWRSSQPAGVVLYSFRFRGVHAARKLMPCPRRLAAAPARSRRCSVRRHVDKPGRVSTWRGLRGGHGAINPEGQLSAPCIRRGGRARRRGGDMASWRAVLVPPDGIRCSHGESIVNCHKYQSSSEHADATRLGQGGAVVRDGMGRAARRRPEEKGWGGRVARAGQGGAAGGVSRRFYAPRTTEGIKFPRAEYLHAHPCSTS